MARTGIDLGSRSVKLVRGEGAPELERITHAGIEEWEPGADGAAEASRALGRLLSRLGLKKRQLERVTVALRSEDAALREAVLPALSRHELQSALPYEARRHLDLEQMRDPVLSCQVLEDQTADSGETNKQMRVLIAAAGAQKRDGVLEVLRENGIEPEVVDLEPLAGLNALLATIGDGEANGRAYGLLDLGAERTRLHLAGHDGGVMTRTFSAEGPAPGGSSGSALSREELAERIRETLTYYRGRNRREVGQLYLSGGGAMQADLGGWLGERLGLSAHTLNPLLGLSLDAAARKGLARSAPRFTVAVGLCRWWDHGDL